jgi:hypothetical protein
VPKTYLGDGAYADFDGYAIVVTTEDGVSVTNRIVFENDVYENLVKFVEKLRADYQASLHGGKEP